MDIQEANNKKQCISEKKQKYPESVLKVSEYLRQAREDTPSPTEMVECEDSLENKTSSSQTPVNIDTTPPSSSSSGSSTPTGSPCSSVSCSDHSCGSLFAKCAEHGRWPLLQTFTNRESPLSQQTFSNRYSQQRSDCFLDAVDKNFKNENATKSQLFKSAVHVCCTRQPNKTIVEVSEERSHGILRREKKIIKNKVKFASGSPAVKETERYEFEESEEVKPCREIVIRRHNSLPDRRIDSDALCELNKIYNTSMLSSKGDQICFSEIENKLAAVRRKTKRQRSKSEDKLNVNKYVCANECNENKVRKNLISSYEGSVTYNWSDKYHKNCANGCLMLKSSAKDKEVNLDKDVYIFRSKDGCFLGAVASGTQKNCKKNYKSHSNYCEHYESERLRCIVSKLNSQAKESEHKIDFLETEILLLRRELKKRDQESIKLQREVHKLRSVLQETSILKQEGDLLSSLQDSHEMPGQSQHVVAIPNPNKKQGVSGESSDHGRNHDQIEIQRFEKDFRRVRNEITKSTQVLSCPSSVFKQTKNQNRLS